MLNQRAYPNVKLGTSSSTVAGYGCFMISVLQALLDRGYSFGVQEWNDILVKNGCFTSGNLLSAPAFLKISPTIFLQGFSEDWSDERIIDVCKNPEKSDRFIVGEVDGRGIGGSGQHFVLIRDVDVANGKVTMTYIGDPWDGLENQKVTTRYNNIGSTKLGNIKSFRTFQVIKKNTNGGNPPITPPTEGTNMSQGNKFLQKIGKDTQMADWANYSDKDVQNLADEFNNAKKDSSQGNKFLKAIGKDTDRLAFRNYSDQEVTNLAKEFSDRGQVEIKTLNEKIDQLEKEKKIVQSLLAETAKQLDTSQEEIAVLLERLENCSEIPNNSTGRLVRSVTKITGHDDKVMGYETTDYEYE